MGGIRIALDVASHIKAVRRAVRGLREGGRTPGQIVAACKPGIVSAYPGWEHPDLIDLEAKYSPPSRRDAGRARRTPDNAPPYSQNLLDERGSNG